MTPDAGESTETPDQLEQVARQVAGEVPQIEVAALVDSVRITNQRPRQYDATLLAISRVTLGTDLDSSQNPSRFPECSG